MENTDEFIARMEADDLEDHAQAARANPDQVKMSIQEYAKHRGLQPQIVHYYVRQGQIDKLPCPCCGRYVIDIAQADDVFKARDNKKNTQRVNAEPDEEVE